MSEWLYEAGIGEARAALVEDGRIVQAAIELAATLTVGTVAEGRLVELLPGRQGRVTLAQGGDVLLAPVPRSMTQGAALTVIVTREAIPERGRSKLPKAQVAPEEATPTPGPDLRARIAATGLPVREIQPHQPDDLEAAGWSELLDEAVTGEIGFGAGVLRMTPTPAMTLFDVDGSPPHEPLSIAAARAVAESILRHGIGGSIGIDFPTLEGKGPRQAVAEALDAALPLPFERTAVNGFGFLQIVRPRPRASIPERLGIDPIGARTRALLRQWEREPPGPAPTYRVPGPVYDRLMANPDWREALERRTGRPLQLERS
ncbi:ribonuclease [Sphingomonas sp. CFBP8993]|uniref:ribonuclease n=1 Tax=Sphingomonas sp. CFBP8993 TaxID=3096526 RepID=UPI002A6B50FC|nr:ribonuclease [Sphingomonas sp. CFBP8993]MDY0957807.1 ribonuclease [Sphingomonas sp. CFBP8993]